MTSNTDEAREARARRKLAKDGLVVRRVRGDRYALLNPGLNGWVYSPDSPATLMELEAFADGDDLLTRVPADA